MRLGGLIVGGDTAVLLLTVCDIGKGMKDLGFDGNAGVSDSGPSLVKVAGPSTSLADAESSPSIARSLALRSLS